MAQLHVTVGDEDLGNIDFTGLTLKDLFAIKAASGLTFGQLQKGLEDMDPAALGALVWFMKLKKGETVPIESIDFKLADFGAEQVDEAPKEPAETP